MLLSDNSIENGLLHLGAMYAGLPVTPISPAYSLMSKDFGKLKHVFSLINPGVVFVDDAERFRPALEALDLRGVVLIEPGDSSSGFESTTFIDLISTNPTAEIHTAHSNVGPDSIAKILFTSGSTGEPKGVINTHRMLSSNQQAIVQLWPFVAQQPPVLVDWLPWNHTFGGNHNFNLILRNGGTLYIDGGRPTPELIDTTITNLSAIAPTLYFNVPRGYQLLLPYLEQDSRLRDHFFSKLDTIFYAAAALPQDLWERLEKLSVAARGEKVAMTSAWGLTESGPLAPEVHFPIERAGVIGLPVPETDLKMIPNHGKLEMRLRGPNITPGYYRRDNLTREAFDEEGFYITGDAGALADPNDPSKGVLFDGRVTENFKLQTGSWVNVGAVRVAAISAGAPIIQDAVVAGHNRDEIGLLVFPNFLACAEIADLQSDTPTAELASHAAPRELLRERLAAYNASNPASSMAIVRVLLMMEPPDIDSGEITDKGYINQRAVLARRHDLVEKLFSDDPEVIRIKATAAKWRSSD